MKDYGASNKKWDEWQRMKNKGLASEERWLVWLNLPRHWTLLCWMDFVVMVLVLVMEIKEVHGMLTMEPLLLIKHLGTGSNII
ncbi:unnamed protein product [Caenorhabditis brenneri]